MQGSVGTYDKPDIVTPLCDGSEQTIDFAYNLVQEPSDIACDVVERVDQRRIDVQRFEDAVHNVNQMA